MYLILTIIGIVALVLAVKAVNREKKAVDDVLRSCGVDPDKIKTPISDSWTFEEHKDSDDESDDDDDSDNESDHELGMDPEEQKVRQEQFMLEVEPKEWQNWLSELNQCFVGMTAEPRTKGNPVEKPLKTIKRVRFQDYSAKKNGNVIVPENEKYEEVEEYDIEGKFIDPNKKSCVEYEKDGQKVVEEDFGEGVQSRVVSRMDDMGNETDWCQYAIYEDGTEKAVLEGHVKYDDYNNVEEELLCTMGDMYDKELYDETISYTRQKREYNEVGQIEQEETREYVLSSTQLIISENGNSKREDAKDFSYNWEMFRSEIDDLDYTRADNYEKAVCAYDKYGNKLKSHECGVDHKIPYLCFFAYSYDNEGNWTKRVEKSGHPGKWYYIITEREIEYW